MASLAAILVASLPILAPAGGPASAETIPVDQTIAAQLAANIAAAAVRIHQLTERYDQALLSEAAIDDQLGVTRRNIRTTRGQMDQDVVSLRREAVLAYIGEGTPVATDTDQASTAAIEQEYVQVAAGNVSDTVQQLRLRQSELRDEQATLDGERNAAAQAIDVAAGARSSAIAAAQSAQSQLNGVQGRIAQMVAEAEAAQVAEQESLARAANQSSREALSLAAAPVAMAPVAPGSQAASSQGQPVNDGLLRAVTASLNSTAGTGSTVATTSASTAATGSTVATTTASTAPSPATTTASTAGTSSTAVSPATTTAPTTVAPTTVAPTTVAPTAVNAPTATTASPLGGAFAALRQCESGDNYEADTGNGYYGAYQFSESTWQDLGFAGSPIDATMAEQDAAAEKLQAEAGWGQWPTCAATLGLIS